MHRFNPAVGRALLLPLSIPRSALPDQVVRNLPVDDAPTTEQATTGDLTLQNLKSLSYPTSHSSRPALGSSNFAYRARCTYRYTAKYPLDAEGFKIPAIS